MITRCQRICKADVTRPARTAAGHAGADASSNLSLMTQARPTGTSSGNAAGRTILGNPTNGNAPRPKGACRVLMIGDMIGKPGRVGRRGAAAGPADGPGIDFVTANGENVAGGMGLTESTAAALLAAGVDVITRGNHIWDKREIYPVLDRNERILRPLNYGTQGVPGRGWGLFHALDGSELAVINPQGRTYMQQIENPFTMPTSCSTRASERCPRSALSTSTAS